jgi:cell division septation protein DedD
MWGFRRELYLCASRATCFLYLIANVRQTEEIKRVQKEITNLVDALAIPSNYGRGGTKIWEFEITPPEVSRNLEVFQDSVQEKGEDIIPEEELTDNTARETGNTPQATSVHAPDPDPDPDAWDLWIHEPITLGEFASAVGRKPFEVMAELIKMSIFLDTNSLIEVPVLKELTKRFGGTLRLYEEEPEMVGIEDDFIPNGEEPPAAPVTELQPKPASQEGQSAKQPPPQAPIAQPEPEESTQGDPPAKKADGKHILDLVSNALNPKDIPAPKEEEPHFKIGSRTIIRAGSWIEDSNYGIGRVLTLNTRPGYADSHRVWFADSNMIFADYALRGRVTKVLAETRIPAEIRDNCPDLNPTND